MLYSLKGQRRPKAGLPLDPHTFNLSTARELVFATHMVRQKRIRTYGHTSLIKRYRGRVAQRELVRMIRDARERGEHFVIA